VVSASRAGREAAWSQLAAELDGELFDDEGTRRLYACDASIYEQLPAAVVCPRGRADCVALVEFAMRQGVSLIARGAGTSLAGQCVGPGFVVDTARHMDRILEIDVDSRTVTVEPGVVPARLNAALAPHGLRFGPYPSTGDRCTLGGMLGNNAWGTHVLRDGTTRDKVIALEVVLSDGSTAEFRPLSEATLAQKVARDGVEGDAYRDVILTLTQHLEAVRERFPAPDGPLNNGGYALDVLAAMQPWDPDGSPLNLAPLFAGSEGTLGLVTCLTVSLEPLPSPGRLLCPHFASMEAALAAVSLAADAGAAAIELLDAHILALGGSQTGQRPTPDWVSGRPAAILIIELAEPDAAVLDERARALAAVLREGAGCEACPTIEGPAAESVWALRRAGLGLLMGRPGPRRAVTGLEDASIPVERLAELWRWVRDRAAAMDLELAAYGPVSVGVMHLRPFLALEEPGDRQAYETLMAELARKVHELGGYFTAKHGDGRMRGHYLAERFGPQVMRAFADVKAAFDPRALFNPGKILDPLPLTADLRYARAAGTDLRPGLDWSRQNGLVLAAQQCHGAGVCLGTATDVMCPSYRATREELHGVRGRANLLRQVLTGARSREDLADPLLMQALGLCVSCKACRRECPAGTNVAGLKAEVQDAWHARHGVPFGTRVFAALPELSDVGSRLPALANWIMRSGALHRLLGTDPARPLPALAGERFSRWWQRREPGPNRDGPGVGLLIDPLSEFYEPQVPRAAVRVLEHLGYRVVPLGPLSLGRVEISLGLLDRARARAQASIDRITNILDPALPLVGLEPSELLTLRDELPGLLTDPQARDRCTEIGSRALLWQEFILTAAPPQLDGTATAVAVRVHVHCHERALAGTRPSLEALARLPGVRPSLLPSGCCGMAGVFGYRRERVEIARRIGELGPLRAVRDAPEQAIIVATGSSCRQQIRLETGRRALHPAELWERLLYGGEIEQA
jgi:FAD/FMN-containing dehydrogenase/Fe-S oxidoreductase